ncbi:Dbl homology domain-containing protein [Ophiocordyceps camponoti-floridani]|uniref:Dbl homology domain-containing protein n=1 Tax=Ophiocordyceps camponoti-floridani TaxID=2030778 RepID=A0A8H4Q6S4_9HYPO|nr:Dbl homology domain-containing protein [Ophiocordyceps camponoti-floridani]
MSVIWSEPSSPFESAKSQPCGQGDQSLDECVEAHADFDQEVVTLELQQLHFQGIETLETSRSIENIGDTLQAPTSLLPLASVEEHSETPSLDSPQNSQNRHVRPFHRWVQSFHRKARRRSSVLATNAEALSPGQIDDALLSPPISRMSSSSGSSSRFFSAVRSASFSIASASIATRSRRNTALSRCVSRTDRSSRASATYPRASEDSAVLEKTDMVDVAAMERSMQRRRILEELISTEEGYIGDVRFLMNVYVTILASLPAMCMGLRSSINKNLTDIVELHEEILGELHRAVPHSEYTQPLEPRNMASWAAAEGPGHRRWVSVDGAVERRRRVSWLQKTPGMLAEPQVVAEVSKIFAKKMNRFFIYKEYGAKYELMIKDVASAHQVMPQWETHQKGLEMLASVLGSAKNAKDQGKKALTMGDLLVKPIQRVCKYPLLFAELLKCTPVSDCPNSHMEVDSVLTRLREANAEINRATDDSTIKATLERTWLLQDRLLFPHRKLDAASKNRLRSFGHIRLCGTLHVCWQSPSGVDGQYLICLLYRDVLCLASAGKADPLYMIQACVSLNGASVEDVDNGRGLQCHTAPFSWKLVFECDHQLYEMIMTACTPKEEVEWRKRLSRRAKDGSEPREPAIFSSLDLDIKSLGIVFGKPGTVARRISIHRATTVGPKSPLCQVVLKNTSIVRDTGGSVSASLTINRSHSVLTTQTRMPVLAPSRSERARLEALLADVWTREILPFPGMTTRARSEHLVRTSASTVMRKLSVTSIASSFARRSSSLTQKAKPSEEQPAREESKRRAQKSSKEDACADGKGSDENMTHRKLKRARTAHAAMFEGRGTISTLQKSSANSQRLVRRGEKMAGAQDKENKCRRAGDEAGRKAKAAGGKKTEEGSVGLKSYFR